jgi:hypothetical protein
MVVGLCTPCPTHGVSLDAGHAVHCEYVPLVKHHR